MPNEIPSEVEEKVARSFQAVLDGAVLPYELGRLSQLADEDKIFIQRKVERMLYEPKLPNGGGKERRIIERLKKLALETEWAGHGRAHLAIGQWEKVLPDDPRNAGRYYVRRKLTPKTDRESYDWYLAVKESAAISRFWDKKWFAELMIEGMPEPVSNFKMECLFLLRKSNGSVDRLVQLRNNLGEVSRGEHHHGAVLLDEEAFASPEKFRRWCLRWGNFNWAGNQTDLHKLHEDIGRLAAWRVINRIDSVGWYEVKTQGKPTTQPKL